MNWHTGTILAIVACIFFFRAFTWKKKAENKRLPPGPRGLPIIGNLLMIGNKPHRDLQRLAQKYGPIMHLRFGLMPVIVVSSPEAAELFLKTHDLVFASRPPSEFAKLVVYNQQDLLFAPYGSYWRNMRKICMLELLSNHKISSFMFIRKEEVDLLVQYIQEAASCGSVVDLTSKVSSLSMDVSTRMIIGKKYDGSDHFDEKGFKATIREGVQLGTAFNLADYIPQIKGLDLQRLRKRMKVVAKDFDMLLEKIIEEHVQSKDENRVKDFVDVMLGFMGSKETKYRLELGSIKAIILDMLLGSMDTSAAAINWIMSELIRHTRVTKKLQKELENVVGIKRMVQESDLNKLEYLDMVVKESFRLHPVAALIAPHLSREDCTVNGFHIPKNSRIFVNTWAIGRDQRIWTDADKFYPERFDGSDIDLCGHNFELIPFGAGRRGCPGMHLGLTVIRLIVAQLVHCFDWELPDNILADELDMTEEFGIVCARVKHLLAVPTWRLKI